MPVHNARCTLMISSIRVRVRVRRGNLKEKKLKPHTEREIEK